VISLLIVDDEQKEREGIAFLIEKYNFPFQVSMAGNGREALELFKSNTYDILITDIRMPFMDGLELCEKIRPDHPETIIIILSAYGDFEYTQKAIKIKVDDYLLKPVEIDEFHRAMSDAMDEIERRMVELTTSPYDSGSDLSISDFIKKAIADVENNLSEADLQGCNLRVIKDVIRLIEANYTKDVGLEWIAGQVYLSSSHLSRLFKKATGQNITQFITMLRMYKAKQLLTRTNMKIVDVGQQVGYYNASYFCMLFKKYYGITPNQMREGTNDKNV